MTIEKTTKILRVCIWTLPVLLFLWIVNRNFIVFGPTTLSCTADHCDQRIKSLNAREREVLIGTAKNAKTRYRLYSGNPLTFSAELFRPINMAVIHLVFTGGMNGNGLSIAYSTRTGKEEVVALGDSSPLMATLAGSWDSVRKDGVVLFQKKGGDAPRYDDVDTFFNNLPLSRKIGAYRVDVGARVELPSYTPAPSSQTITLSTRGSQTFVTYIGKSEDLDVTLTMQNSNRNDGKDNATIDVYRGIDRVATQTVNDNGSGKGNGRPSPARDVRVTVPHPGLGTYQIVVSTTDDQFIRSITTRQRYFMWQKKLYLAGSKEYQALGSVEDKPVTVYLKDASYLTATTAHESMLQTIMVGEKKLDVNAAHTEFTTSLTKSNEFIPITVPLSDVNLLSDGVFVLSKDESFTVPTKNIVMLNGGSDPSIVDYVVAQYMPIKQQGNWYIVDTTIKADLGRSPHFSISFDPPLGPGNEALRVKELILKLYGGPFSMQDIRKGVDKLLNRGS
ncbi:MAG: hypothetical protein V1907_04085 [Candidatus Kerfeldbacteria bacterium]